MIDCREKLYLIKKGTTLYFNKSGYNNYFEYYNRTYPFMVNKIFKDEKNNFKVELISSYHFCRKADPKFKKLDNENFKNTIIVSLKEIGTKYKVKNQYFTEYIYLKVCRETNLDEFCFILSANVLLKQNDINIRKITEFCDSNISEPILEDFYLKPVIDKLLIDIIFEDDKFDCDFYENVAEDESEIEINKNRFNIYSNIIELDRYGVNEIDINEIDNIYYFINYYPKEICQEHNNSYYWANYNKVINFKKGYATPYDNPQYYFRYCLNKHISGLVDEWIVCSVPGHDQVGTLDNAVNKMLRNFRWDKNLIIRPDLILRSEAEICAKHDKMYGDRDYLRDLQTLALNKEYDLKDKNVIVIDDVVTSGSTFIAVKKLLLDAGVKRIMCFALASTVNKIEFYK